MDIQYHDTHTEHITDWQEIDIIVSRDCTLRCTYCYLQKHKDESYDLDSIIKNVDKVLSEIEHDDNQHGVIFGLYPEPWVNVKRTNEIISRVLELLLKYPKFMNNYMFSLGTSGVNLDVKIPLVEANLDHVDISVTIDGVKEQHDMYRVFKNGKGSFDLVKKNILKYQEKYNLRSTKVTVGPQTIKYIYESTLFLWNEMNFDSIYMNVLFENVWGSEYEKLQILNLFEQELDKLSNYIINNNLYEKKYTSLIGSNMIENNNTDFSNRIYCGAAVMRSVDSDGSVYPCFRLSPYSLNGDKTFNLYKNSEVKRSLKLLDKYNSTPNECLNCNLLDVCAMCVGHAYEETGSLFSRTKHHCEFIKLQNKYAKKIQMAMEKYYND